MLSQERLIWQWNMLIFHFEKYFAPFRYLRAQTSELNILEIELESDPKLE